MMQKTLVCLFHDNAAAEKAERAIERAGFDTKNVRVLSLRNAPENTGEPYAYNIPLTFSATTDHEYNAFGGLSAPTPFFLQNSQSLKTVLEDSGIPTDESDFYRAEIESGTVFFSIPANHETTSDIADILTSSGCLRLTSYKIQ